tara:strand:+ start:4858 stop:7371 length:2514 start_codon:yes stop_codon:yes gene_type:complete
MVDKTKNQIDKAMDAVEKALDIEPLGEEIQFEKSVDFDGFEIQEDGSAEIVGEQPIDQSQIPFDANLAEYIDEDQLTKFSNDLVGDFEGDRESRKDWEDTYIKGLDMLGFKYEDRTQPFEGASGVVHPLLAESVTQFQAQAYKELLPPSGPVRTQIVGDLTPMVEQQAERVKEYMNYYILNVMEEYDPEMDQLLFYLPLSGSAFKKVYYDQILKRCVAKFVSSEDCVINYAATDLDQAERITHIVKMSSNELRKLQVSGFYRDVPVTSGSVNTSDEVEDKINELDGATASSEDDEHVILEMHVDADVPNFEDTSGIKLPYIVTIDQYSSTILSIRRNYEPNDPTFKKKQYFIHFKFLPGLGFYGFGLIHMLGGLSRTATSVLRQLIDAGTLANLPAGFKARGMRIRDHDQPLQPGEFRDVDVTGQSIKESLLPLPYKEPSQTLFALLGFAVDAGKAFAAIADMKMGEGNEQNPVGTTLALLERGTKVMSAIQKRLHFSQRKEFKLLANSIKMFTPPEYPYQVIGGNRMIKQADFDDRVDIIPVSDPNIFSMSQRVMLAQQQLQLAQSNPQMHNLREAYRRMYQAMGVDNIDAILKPDQNQPAPMSPAVENAMAMKGKPLKVFPQQDHSAHMKAHAEFMFTRMVQINPPLYSMLQSHMSEHIAAMAGMQVQKQFAEQEQKLQMAMQQSQMNPQMMQQLQMQAQQMAVEKANAIAKIEADITTQLARDEEERTKREQQDPLVKLKQQEIDLRAAEVMSRQQDMQTKTVMNAARLDMDRDKIEADTTIKLMETADRIDDRAAKNALSNLKENVSLTKEAMKNETTVRTNDRRSKQGQEDQ